MGDSSIINTGNLPIVWHKDSEEHVYEKARVGRVFNSRRPKRYPIAVVQAKTEDDIVAAVRLASQLGCRVSVRSGGHSWAAWSVRDDAILIDLGEYNHLHFDEAQRTVIVSPSTTGRILNGYLIPRGYMFAGGHCPDVGLGGFLLQGGMGWNCKNWGWSCEKVKAIDVVTADGQLLHCDKDHNAELLWAARGAGPGFPAIVTKFHLEVHENCPGMLDSVFIYPMSKYREVMSWIVQVSDGYDSRAEIVCVSTIPAGMTEHCVIADFLAFGATEEDSRHVLEKANTTRPPGFLVESPNQPSSLASRYKDQAIANPAGHRYCAENAYISNDVDVTSVLEAAFTTQPHPKAFCIWFGMNPTSRRQLPDMALSMHTDHYFALYTVWEDEKDDIRCQSWVKDIMVDVEKHSEGAYLGDADFQVRRTRFWEDENARRLMEIRRTWDPKGRVCGYLDQGDASGVNGLKNEHEWKVLTNPIRR